MLLLLQEMLHVGFGSYYFILFYFFALVSFFKTAQVQNLIKEIQKTWEGKVRSLSSVSLCSNVAPDAVNLLQLVAKASGRWSSCHL